MNPMQPVKLVREIDGYLYRLEIARVKASGASDVQVAVYCPERSWTMPESLETLRGGTKKSDSKGVIERARLKAKRDGWAETLSTDAQARIDARIAARVADHKARLQKFPATALDRKLADAIARPKGVAVLDLRGGKDRVTVIPPSIRKLEELEVLHLEGNGLKEIPEELAELTSLRALHLAHNALEQLPRPVWFMLQLVVMNLHANPIVVSENFGNYQQPGLELQIAGTPHRIGVLPFGKLRVLGIDTERLFPLDTEMLAGGAFPLEALHLYGPAPTKRDIASAKRMFPQATIEHVPKVADGPRIVTELTPSATPARPGKKRPMHAEQLAEVEALIALGRPLRIPEAQVRDAIEPYVELISRKATKRDLVVGASRLGGVPDLARKTKWPRGRRGSMLFAAQIDLAQLAPFDTRGVLPSSGLLSFFIAGYDEGRVIHTEGPVEPAEWPDDVDFAVEGEEPLTPCGIDLRGAIVTTAPRASDPKKWRALEKSYRKRRKGALHRALIGDGGETGGAIADDDVVLLTLGSDPRANMMWGDAGSIFFAIDPKSLANREWARVRIAATQ